VGTLIKYQGINSLNYCNILLLLLLLVVVVVVVVVAAVVIVVEDNIKMDLQELGGVVGTGWRWLRIGTGGGHL